MEIKINFEKRHLTVFLLVVMLGIGIGFVFASVPLASKGSHEARQIKLDESHTLIDFADELIAIDGQIICTAENSNDPTSSCYDDVGGGGASLWSQSGSDIYYTEGNVGIGASPGAKLDVLGTIRGMKFEDDDGVHYIDMNVGGLLKSLTVEDTIQGSISGHAGSATNANKVRRYGDGEYIDIKFESSPAHDTGNYYVTENGWKIKAGYADSAGSAGYATTAGSVTNAEYANDAGLLDGIDSTGFWKWSGEAGGRNIGMYNVNPSDTTGWWKTCMCGFLVLNGLGFGGMPFSESQCGYSADGMHWCSQAASESCRFRGYSDGGIPVLDRQAGTAGVAFAEVCFD